MHPVASLAADHARRKRHLLVPLLFVALAATANVHSPAQHQLLIISVSWAIVAICSVFWAGLASPDKASRRTSWLAGGFLALSQLCDRAACDKEGIWSGKALLPLLVVFVSDNDLISRHLSLPFYSAHATSSKSQSDNAANAEHRAPSFRVLAAVTLSAGVVLSTSTNAPPTFALGISSVIFAAVGLILLESAVQSSSIDDGLHKSSTGLTSGASAGQKINDRPQRSQQLVALRDVAIVIVLVCGLASYLIEPKITSSGVSWEPLYRFGDGSAKPVRHYKTFQLVLVMILVNIVVNVLTFLMISQQGGLHISCHYLLACMCAKFRYDFSFPSIWFTLICTLSVSTVLSGQYASSSTPLLDARNSLRLRRGLFGVTTLSFALFLLQHLFAAKHGIPSGPLANLHTAPPISPYGPVALDLERGHPAAQLIESAEKEFRGLVDRQSKTLAEAVAEYRRRNGIAPPPHFDKWYEFASRNGVVLIDEFDAIMQSLLPFWSLEPSTIRARIRNALGHDDSALISILIRDGSVVKAEGEPEWQKEATAGMMEKFVQYLPDMDLGFNIHDEPRVSIPSEQLTRMVANGHQALVGAAKRARVHNSYSPRPSDVNDGHRIEEVSYTRFNRFAHQQTWTHSRLSCPMESQAQQFEDQTPDNLTAYAAGPLNYVLNQTAFTDICNSPSFSSTHGFFGRPNAFSVTYDLTPIFSSSKISSFQDILFPSPWYWSGKVSYEEKHDTTWENKTNSLYWRGSTTGGFSRKGGWRRQHRQRIVQRLNALDKANVSIPAGQSNSAHTITQVDRTLFKSLIDVKFSHIGQCDPGDCDAQKEFFHIVERADGQDAWYYKHLLDMDGNAFSGRFYSFLRSKSLTYKMALFREWHQEWLVPWVHYVPLSLIGDEHLDLVRWFSGADPKGPKEGERANPDKGGTGNSPGEQKARAIAERSSEWAAKALRNVDLEAWFFRLLLEYGRVIDDDRENIGYPGP